MNHKFCGLTARFALLLLVAALASGTLFLCLQQGGRALLQDYLERSNVLERLTDQRLRNLQTYIKDWELSAKDASYLNQWVKDNPLILLEVYRGNVLLYSSSAPEEMEETDLETPHYEWISYHELQFSDGSAEVVIYADESYRLFTYLTITALLLSVLLFLMVFLRGCRKVVRYICRLSAEIQAMEGGDLDVPITIEGSDELASLARSLSSLEHALKEQREREFGIYQASQAMITAMSHDLRTPLTALQIYTDILRYKKYDESQMEEYLKKIDVKASQIRQLAENIFEYSLVSRYQEIQLDPPQAFRAVFHDLLSEAVAQLNPQGFHFSLYLEWPDVEIVAYAQYNKRLIDNLVSNIMKYANPAVSVEISVSRQEKAVSLIFQNEILRRPREQSGTHIGIANIETMMKKMNGDCIVTSEDGHFCLELRFPICEGAATLPGSENEEVCK